MGFSLSASAAVIAVALFIALEIVTGSIFPTMEGINDSYDDLKNRMIDQVHTNINITSIDRQTNESNYDYNITIKNTGSTTLETNDFVIILNGTKQLFTSSQSYLYPDCIVYFTIVNVPDAGSNRIKVVADNGISDYAEYVMP
ncbi:MAG: hypothetical protein NT038_05155 [Euryarchaeota archaeon]|nr:hypothetical protein [Euryarchaeota archaeon]